MSKGSNPRPFEIPQEEYASNHERIFGAPKARERYIPPPVRITNNGSRPVFVKVGAGSNAASASDLKINPGGSVIVDPSKGVEQKKDVDPRNNS